MDDNDDCLACQDDSQCPRHTWKHQELGCAGALLFLVVFWLALVLVILYFFF